MGLYLSCKPNDPYSVCKNSIGERVFSIVGLKRVRVEAQSMKV